MRERILAIDASLSSTGWAVLDKISMDVVELGKITTTAGTKKAKITEDERIMTIVRSLFEIQGRYNISEAAMEDGFVGASAKVGMQLSKLRGAIMAGLSLTGATTSYMLPTQIRHELLGEKKGNAKKEEVAQGVLNFYPYNLYVQSLGPFSDKDNKDKNSDMYDAVSIGAAHLLSKRRAENAQTA